MINDQNIIKKGCTLVDPCGILHEVEEVFVPKNQPQKSAKIPSAFRNEGRKIVIFDSGIMRLADVKRRYSLVA